MPIAFVNIWETKILDTIRTFLNDEFAGSIPVYTGNFKDMGSQSIRLNPIGSDLLRIDATRAETREYIVDVSYTFKEKMVKKDTWEHILRQLSHTEEEEEIEGLNVIRWEWRGTYTGNTT